MASTYTANSGIELITQGEKSGTWGDTTNNNLKIIDRNINQQLSLDLGSPVDYGGSTYTLTTTDGALSEGQYALLSLEGSPSGAVTIDIDPDGQQKIFFVVNSCGQTVTFQQGNGTGGTSNVPDNSSAIIYSDGAGTGAQVSQVSFTTLPSLTVSGAATLSGTNTLSGATTTSGALTVSGDITIDGYHPTGTSNIAWGATALDAITSGATYNIALGQDALTELTSGDYNTALGYDALDSVTTGSGNIGLGYLSGAALTDGTYNVAIGYQALDTSGTGVDHAIAIGTESASSIASTSNYAVAIGYQALQNSRAPHNIGIGYQACNVSNGTGTDYEYNIGIGYQTLGGVGTKPASSSDEYGNVAIGYKAAGNSTYCYRNVFIGLNAGLGDSTFRITSASDNIIIGYNAGYNITSPDRCTVIGTSAGNDLTNGNENTLIGHNAGSHITTGYDNVCLGNDSGSETTWIDLTTENGKVVIGNGSTTTAYVKPGVWTASSDIRDKTNIEEVPHGLDFLSQLDPIRFQFLKERGSEEVMPRVHYGYSAQDILALEGENPVIIEDTDPEHLKFTDSFLIPILHKAVKELKAENEALKARLDAAGI